MFTSVQQCTDYLFTLKATTHKGEPLSAMRTILEYLGNPHEQIKTVHIAGSNGKGSTLNALREMLDVAGYRVGIFTSPHLERVNERVMISGEQIPDEQFLYYANEIHDVIDKHLDGQMPSFFEWMTLIAFLHFAEQQVDIALIETGIGGRLDSTNVITPLVSIITTISLEHTAILGDTYDKVAYEKAGIIKQGVPIVTAVKQADALAVIRQTAGERQARLFVLSEQFCVKNCKQLEGYQRFTYQYGDMELDDIQLRMLGEHQIANASLALTAALLLCENGFGRLTDDVLRQALSQAQWAGRFEQFVHNIIIDGAHNSEGTAALMQTLHSVYPNRNYHFIYAALADKDHANSIALMEEVAASIAFTEIPLPNAMLAEQLEKLSNHPKKAFNPDWQAVINTTIQTKDQADVLVITGSLYFIAEVRKFLKERGL